MKELSFNVKFLSWLDDACGLPPEAISLVSKPCTSSVRGSGLQGLFSGASVSYHVEAAP